jgi:hypothetical protein
MSNAVSVVRSSFEQWRIVGVKGWGTLHQTGAPAHRSASHSAAHRVMVVPLDDFRNCEAIEQLVQKHLGGATCKTLPVDPNGRAIFPGARVGTVVGLKKEETALALADTHFAMVAGCVIYETLGERHYSQVCVVLERLKGGGWRSTNGITHNGAD